jgi:hypothetical protein
MEHLTAQATPLERDENGPPTSAQFGRKPGDHTVDERPSAADSCRRLAG